MILIMCVLKRVIQIICNKIPLPVYNNSLICATVFQNLMYRSLLININNYIEIGFLIIIFCYPCM